MSVHSFPPRQDDSFRNLPELSIPGKCDPWYAVQVVARQEHRVAALLDYKGYEYFLPVARPRRQSSARVEPEALFPGYVFCRLRPEANSLIVTTPGVIRILGFGRSPVAVPEEEIRNVRLMVDSDLPTETTEILRTGLPVLIETGPLTGLRGLLVAVKNCHRIAVSVELLCRSVTVEVDGRDIRPTVQPKPPASVVTARPGMASPLVSCLARI